MLRPLVALALTWTVTPARSAASNGVARQRPIRHTATPMNLAVATNHGGGRGGSGGAGDDDFDADDDDEDDEREFLRLLSHVEADKLLDDWGGRSRLYLSHDDADVRERHHEALAALHEIQRIDSRDEHGEARMRHMTLGLFSESEDVRAIAVADLTTRGSLAIQSLVLHPAENNEPCSSTAALRMMVGLRSLAETISLPLDLEPLRRINKGRFWLAGISLLECGDNPCIDECELDLDDFY